LPLSGATTTHLQRVHIPDTPVKVVRRKGQADLHS